MLYSTNEVKEILKITGTTIQTRINQLNIVPFKSKSNSRNINFFTEEQIEMIRINSVYKKQNKKTKDEVYYIYESKMNNI